LSAVLCGGVSAAAGVTGVGWLESAWADAEKLESVLMGGYEWRSGDCRKAAGCCAGGIRQGSAA
jgi:hypothetical protein